MRSALDVETHFKNFWKAGWNFILSTTHRQIHTTPFQSTALHNKLHNLFALRFQHCIRLPEPNSSTHCWNQTSRIITYEWKDIDPDCNADKLHGPNQSRTNHLLCLTHNSYFSEGIWGRRINASSNVNTNARTTTIIGNNIKQIFRNAPVSTYKTN